MTHGDYATELPVNRHTARRIYWQLARHYELEQTKHLAGAIKVQRAVELAR